MCYCDSSFDARDRHTWYTGKRPGGQQKNYILFFSQTQPWKKDKQSKLLAYCLWYYFVLLDAMVEPLYLISKWSWLEHSINTSPRKRLWANGSRPSYYPSPHSISPLHLTFPFLSNSFPLAGQDYSNSDRHIIMKANQMHGSG